MKLKALERVYLIQNIYKLQELTLRWLDKNQIFLTLTQNNKTCIMTMSNRIKLPYRVKDLQQLTLSKKTSNLNLTDWDH